MDTVTLAIINALIAGTLAGVTESTKRTILDMYLGLKNRIVEKYGGKSKLENSLDELQKNPQSKKHQNVVKKELGTSTVATDTEIIQLAQKLIKVLETKVPSVNITGSGNLIGDRSSMNNTMLNAGNNSIVIGGDVTGSNLNIEIHPPEQPKQLAATAPRPLDYFMGREKLLIDIERILVNDTKSALIAITGMGGSGKSSLIKQVAEDVKSRFAENIFWGDLYQSNGDATRILREWAELCGHTLPARKSEEELGNQLRGFLAERHKENKAILVVIDDLREGWLEAGESLLDAVPAGIPIIITTREIDVAQSVKASKIINLDEHPFSDSEASQLAIELSEKKLTVPQSKRVARICEKMPLAIELASRVALDGGAKYLLEKLEDATKRLDVLMVGSRERKDASVRETFKISYESLPIDASLTFRCLGVFAPVAIRGSHLSNVVTYTMQTINAEEILRLLKRYSLLQSDNDGALYHLHALLHDYAKELLDGQEKSDARRGHFACFQSLSQSYAEIDLVDRNDGMVQEFELFYPQMMQALVNFDLEYDAKNSKLEKTQIQSIVEMVDILDKYWTLHDAFEMQTKWFEFAYKVARKLNLPLRQADFARRAGRANATQGKLGEGLKWMKRCEAALGNRKNADANAIRALMHIHRASIYYQKGDLDTSEKECIRGVKKVTIQKRPKIYAEGCNLLGAIKIRTGRLSQSLVDFKKSLAAWKRAGDQYQAYRTEDNLRSALYYLGDVKRLRKAEEDGLKYWKQYPDSAEYAAALTNRGLVHFIDEEYEISAKLHEEAMKKSDGLGELRLRASTRVNLAWPYISLGRFDEAEALLKESLEIQGDDGEFSIDAKRCLAEVEIGRKNYAKAIGLAKIAVKIAKDDDDPLEEGAALRILGQALHLNGDSKQAIKHLSQSLLVLGANDYKYESYVTLLSIKRLYNDIGDVNNEKATSDKAQVLKRKMGLL